MALAIADGALAERVVIVSAIGGQDCFATLGVGHCDRILDPLLQAILKGSVALASCNVLGDCGAYHLGDRLSVNSGDHLQLLRKFDGQAD